MNNDGASKSYLLAKVGDIPEGKGQRFVVGTREIAVFHVNGNYYALGHCCPHMGAGLAHGRLEGEAVACPRHQWLWRLSDGKCLEEGYLGQDAVTYPVQIVGDEIHVLLPEESSPDKGSESS